MKIVIANSIGKDKSGRYIIHSPSRWSESVKNKYNWFAYYPWELAYLSSLLKKHTAHDVILVDGCLMRMDSKDYKKHILKESPDVLIIESATRMINENLLLALSVKKKLGARIIFVGQHATAYPEELLKKGVDYVCIGEYEFTVLDLIQKKSPEKILGLFPNARRPLLDVNTLPWPEDDDISRFDYAIPGEPSSEFREIQMYASRGCPGFCNFCVARNVYYAQPNWRPRKVTDIIAEIKYLKKKYPRMEGVFFDEEVHNGSKQFIKELTSAIHAAGMDGLHYEAMCDVRFLDEGILKMMKNAGYYKIRIGIESASQAVLKRIGKDIDINAVKAKLEIMKDLGLRTYGTFTFGALGSNREEDLKTIKLIELLIEKKLLDNLQTSICTPQPGTPFHNQVKKSKLIRGDAEYDDFDGGNCALVNYPSYSSEEIVHIKNKAQDVRDHFFLKSKFKNKEFWSWASNIIRQHGIWGALIKGIRRLRTETSYQAGKWQK